MTAPVAVDVREVLAELLSFEERHAEYEPRANHEGREAIAAVAELIEAAGDVARIQINRRSPSNDMGKAKQLRLRAALARVGAAP